MKTLDRYIIRNFLYSYLLCFLIMMGLRVVADLFVNYDEFSELDLPTMQRIGYIAEYYACNALVYFHELGGVILVAAAAFSLARMNHTNELTAVLASGVSLYRIILPVLLIAVALALVGTANQEIFIPSVSDRLVRDRDDTPGGGVRVNLIPDAERNVWFSRVFRPTDSTMTRPLVISRDGRLKLAAKLSGRTAVYESPGWWRMTDASVAVLNRRSRRAGGTTAFIWTPRSPEALARGGSGAVGEVDRLRISFERVDPDGGWLIRPRIEVLAPNPAPSGESRVFGVFAAPLAWYGPAGPKDRESGYHLVGPAELTAGDVDSWWLVCRRIHSRCSGGGDTPGERFWVALDATVRQGIDEIASWSGKGQPAAAVTEGILEGLNDGLGRALFIRADDLAALDELGIQLAPGDRSALAARPASLSDQQVRRINRAMLDAVLDDVLVRCQGQLLVPSSLTPDDIALRRTRKWLDYLSSREIGSLLRTGRVTDPDSARLIQHIRVAAPAVNVVMLMLALPFIVSRERHIKASALLCVAMVGGFHVFVFMSRYLGGEVFTFISESLVDYGFAAASPIWGPILAASMPILIFGPVAMLMLVSLENMERPGDNRTLAQILSTLEGRVDRATFWLRGLLPVLAVCVAALFVDAVWIRTPGLLTWAALAAAAWPICALLVKRGHDRDRPGTFLLVLLIPILGWLWVLVDLFALPGDKGTNTYGPPLSNAAD